ncbi:E1B 19K [Bat adenovirus 2]|uniref:E1B protein, small T-antigen n=1 Tax=Bat adenovirus 2 TaxID=696069 RepID=G1FQL6_9ADEN|nr:E1B 19K [Bat adenovirus 2]AEM06263.1 E1B 19K [Bat adenovirus 2]
MDLLRACSTYSAFKYMMKGSTYNSGWVRRWCFPGLSEVVGTLAETHSYRFWNMMPRRHLYWDLVRRGYCTSFFEIMFRKADLSNRGRVLAYLAFVSFLLRNWPQDSVVPEADRLDLICIPAWTRMQSWQQTVTLMQEIEEIQQGTGAEECTDAEQAFVEEEEEQGGGSSPDPLTEGSMQP